MAAKQLSRDQKFTLMYGDAGGVMSHLSPKARRQVKRLAAQRGLTVEGVMQPGPEALRSRSTEGLRKQAISTVTAAYAPVVKELSDRERQVNSLDAKRKLDNEFYRTWLTDQEAKGRASAEASDATLLQVVNDAHDKVGQRYDAAQQALNAQNAATAGNVSDPTQSTANVDASKERATGAADIAQSAAVGQISRSTTERAAIQASNFAAAAALESKRLGDTYQALAGVASDKHKLQLQRAADVTKETSRLLDNEVGKAQANQQYGALAQKLGLQKQQLLLDASKEKHNYQIKKSGVKTDRQKLQLSSKQFDHQLSKDEHDAALADSKYQLDVKKVGQAQAKDNYLRAHKLGPYKPTPKGSTGDANLDKLTRQGRGGVQQANAISNQSKYKTNYKKFRDHLLAQGVNISVINAGWQISRGGINSKTVRNLRGMGVVVPKEWRQGY